jgi:hypothetical protein
MLIREAEKSVTIVTTQAGLGRKHEILMQSLENCKKKGIDIKIAATIDKNNMDIAKDFKKVADVRAIKDINARFVIVDSKQVMFMLLDDEKFHPNYDIGVWINTEFFATALEQLFGLAWKDMKKI